MIEEAPLKRTEAGLVPDAHGWFVMNAREARWINRPARGQNTPLTGWTELEAETYFRKLGVNLIRLEPGEPVGMYHWEADTEDFLILSGEALLIIEGQERELRQWDFVHCPPGTQHIILGAGSGACIVLAVSTREHIGEHSGGGAYTVNDAAIRHGAGIEDEAENEDPYARFQPSEPTAYRDGWLPTDRAGD